RSRSPSSSTCSTPATRSTWTRSRRSRARRTVLTLALVVLLTPLAGFLVQSAVGRRLPRQGDFVTIAAIGASLAASVLILLRVLGGESLHWTSPWIDLGGGLHLDMGIRVDGLTAVMLI